MSFENCAFYSDGTIVDTGSTVYDLDISFRNCYFYNVGAAWYRTPAARIKSTTPDNSVAFTPTGGVILENCFFSDTHCTGNTDPADPPGAPTTGVAFPVIEFEGVSGRNVSFQRALMSYNIEDSPWMRLTKCRINGVTLSASVSGSFTPFSYASYSDGIIEILGQSFITDLRYVNALRGEVHRSVVYVTNVDDYHSASDLDTDLPAVIDGLHIAFDDVDAWFEFNPAGAMNGLLLTQAGNSIVRRFVVNQDCKVARQDVGSGIGYTFSLVIVRNSHNTLENFLIHANCVLQGSFGNLITVMSSVGSPTSESTHNTIQNGKIFIEWGAAIDPPTRFFPIQGIYVFDGSGCVIDNISFLIWGDIPAPYLISLNRAIHVDLGYFTRVVNCHIDVYGDCDAGPTDLISFNTDVDQSCTCIGNILRVRSGTAFPTIGGSPGADIGNLLLKTATPAQPSS
jgi:hypothetical protein